MKDADTLEWMVTLRGEEVKGNVKAKRWINIAVKRLKTKGAKRLAKVLLKTNPDSWWFDYKDAWFVDRKAIDKKWGVKKKKK